MKYVWKVSLLIFAFLLVAFSSVGLDVDVAKAGDYGQAPQLGEMVQAGKLPPLEERLPDDPLILEPLEKIGQYGGTWHRFSTLEEWSHFRMAMYGWSLVRWKETSDGYTVVPNLVKIWESNSDKSSWTLHFREGVRWSDGAPLTVDDFLFWWREMALNPQCRAYVPDWARAGGETMSVTKIDDYTMRLEYSAPTPLLMKRLAMWPNGGLPDTVFVLAPAHYLKQFHPDYGGSQGFETLQAKSEWWHNFDCPVLTAWKPVKENLGGERGLLLKRNPYYYAVDRQGNQLPYIDQVKLELVSLEGFEEGILRGGSDMQLRPQIRLSFLPQLESYEEKEDFEVLMWDSGSGSGPIYYPNRNYPDPEKRQLYRNPKFLRALSHAVDRGRINFSLLFGRGTPTTGTMSPKAIEYHRSLEGENIYERWRDLAGAYEPGQSETLLEEVGVIDVDDDGWRELPGGGDLILRIDADSGVTNIYKDCNELVESFWEEVGLQVELNYVSGEKLAKMQTEATFDIRDSWEVGDGPDHLVYPNWLVPVNNRRWAPLYGAYFRQGEEGDNPPSEKPPAGSPVARLQDLYRQAKVEPDPDERDQLVFDMIAIHLNNGPFFIGTAGNYPRVGVVSDRMRNVPRKEDLPLDGFVNAWIMSYIAITNPPTFSIKACSVPFPDPGGPIAVEGPPQDLDGDGDCEDTNGDGEVQFVDAILLSYNVGKKSTDNPVNRCSGRLNFDGEKGVGFADAIWHAQNEVG